MVGGRPLVLVRSAKSSCCASLMRFSFLRARSKASRRARPLQRARWTPPGRPSAGRLVTTKRGFGPFVKDLSFAHHPAQTAPTLARCAKFKARAGHLDRSRLYRPVKLSEAFAQAALQPLVARQSQYDNRPILYSRRAIISSRANPLVARTIMRTLRPKRLRMAQTF